MTVRDVLLKAAELCERGWCQRRLAATSAGWMCRPESPNACAWCAVGAICKATGDDMSLNDASMTAFAYCVGHIPVFNDAPGRTQAEVVSALRRAAEQAGDKP